MTTPNMTLVLPTDHGSSDIWDTVLDTVFGLIDAHDHTTGKGVRVPSAGINVNADLSFAAFALTTAKAVTFNETTTASVAGYTDALFVNSADHNLYFRNSSGSNVQITAGSTINVSLVGGIGGDYAAVGALLSYVDASRDYLLQQEGSPRPWAGLETGDIKLYQKAASISQSVTLKSPNALAGSYTVTWPAAVPGAGSIVQMATDGTLTATNVLASNQNLKLQGTGYLQRGNGLRLYPITPGGDWQVSTGAPPAWKSAGNSPSITITASTTVYYPLRIESDKDRVQSVVVYGRALVGAATLSLYLSSGMGAGAESLNVMTLSGGGTTLSVPADGLYNPRTLTLQTPTQPTTGEVMMLRVDIGVGNSMDIRAYGVTADVP